MSSNLYDPLMESISTDDLEEIQLTKINNILFFVKENSRFYKKHLNGYLDKELITLEDFSKIPLTSKKDLTVLDIYDNLCVPLEDVAEVHFSSGTTGNPLPSFMSHDDLAKSRKALARTWYMQGIRKNSIFGMLASYGLFSAGLLNHYAIQEIGAFIVPISSSSTEKTLSMMVKFGIDSSAAVASYYLHLIHKLENSKYGKKELKLKKIIAGGEPFTEKQRSFIEEKLNVSLYDQYGLCEINTGLAGECDEKNGLHILADYAYPEIVNPDTGELCNEGEEGELVLTTLDRKASPLIRYRTGDLTSINYEKCGCGRTLPRISRLKGRISKTIFYKGIKLEREYISSLMEQLEKFIHPYFWRLNIVGETGDEKIVIEVLPLNQVEFSDIETIVKKHIKNNLELNVNVKLFTKDELGKVESEKLHHFVDNRL